MRYLFILFPFLFSFEAIAQTSPAYKDTVFTEYFRRTSGWTAGDATISVPVPCENKTIWLFGDSYLDHVEEADTTLPCLFQVRNAMMVQDLEYQDEFRTIIDESAEGVDRTPIKIDDGNETFFWPKHGYAEGDTAFIFWGQHNSDLENLGTWLATVDVKNLSDASAVVDFEEMPDLSRDSLGFGNSVLIDSAENYVYVYGVKKVWLFNAPVVARFPVGGSVKGPWEFYNGKDWTSDPDDVEVIFEGSDVVSDFSVMKFQEKYIMVSQEVGFLTCGLGREIYSWESDTPYGPFTNKKILYTIEDKYRGNYWVTYNATAHPEFVKDNELLISYNVNGFDGGSDTPCEKECEDAFRDRRHADGYRPKFVRVPLDFIVPGLQVPDASFSPCDVSTPVVERRDEFELEIYPNPVENGYCTIKTDGVTEFALRITDVTGRTVKEAAVSNGFFRLQIKRAGIYFVTVSADRIRIVKKLIVL